jgi:nucleotide-binding universal stress UspA family protein
MKTYLLVINGEHDSENLIARAIEDCLADDVFLHVLFTAEPAQETGLTKQLTEQSFLGVGQSKEVAEQVKRTSLRDATYRLDEIEDMATSKGVKCETDIVEGVFADEAIQSAQQHGAERLYVGRRARGTLHKLLFDSDTVQIAEGTPCEVIVVGPEP